MGSSMFGKFSKDESRNAQAVDTIVCFQLASRYCKDVTLMAFKLLTCLYSCCQKKSYDGQVKKQ